MHSVLKEQEGLIPEIPIEAMLLKCKRHAKNFRARCVHIPRNVRETRGEQGICTPRIM